jgi:hypothetical protein
MTHSVEKDPRADLEHRIEMIESGYEFMLAYAAQGRASDRGPGGSRSPIRDHLKNMEEALDGLGVVAQACVQERSDELAAGVEAFLSAVEHDAARAQAVIRLVAAQADVSSQLVDNLNASIHLRALLTDLFVLDEALKARAPAAD